MLKPLTLSLSCSLPHALLLLRLLLLKQTNRRISTDDVLPQAASFNGIRMALARDPSLSTVHTSNHEILLVDVHATNKQLRTVQHACMRASLFSLANSANVRMCFIETEIWNGRKGGNAPNNTPDMFNGDASHSKHSMKASNPPRCLCFHYCTDFVVRNGTTCISMRLFLCRSISHDKTSNSSVRANC